MKVLWSDETKIQLFGINLTQLNRVWRKRNAACDPKNTIFTEVETCFGGVFLLRVGQLHRIKGTMDKAMNRQDQGIENGSWMGIPA